MSAIESCEPVANRDAFEQGWRARSYGFAPDANPYAKGSSSSAFWWKGHQSCASLILTALSDARELRHYSGWENAAAFCSSARSGEYLLRLLTDIMDASHLYIAQHPVTVRRHRNAYDFTVHPETEC